MHVDMFQWIFAGLYVVFFALRAYYAPRRKALTIKESRRDVLDTVLLAFAFVTMMVLPFVHWIVPEIGFARYALPTWAAIVGLCIGIAGLILFWRSHHDLGRNWSPTLELYDEHALVTAGVYRWIRHPMYLAIALYCGAQALLLQNWITGLPAFVSALSFIVLRLPREEKMLLDRFGDRYRSYRKTSWRVMPGY